MGQDPKLFPEKEEEEEEEKRRGGRSTDLKAAWSKLFLGKVEQYVNYFGFLEILAFWEVRGKNLNLLCLFSSLVRIHIRVYTKTK